MKRVSLAEPEIPSVTRDSSVTLVGAAALHCARERAHATGRSPRIRNGSRAIERHDDLPARSFATRVASCDIAIGAIFFGTLFGTSLAPVRGNFSATSDIWHRHPSQLTINAAVTIVIATTR
jgi:hypothetical protein